MGSAARITDRAGQAPPKDATANRPLSGAVYRVLHIASTSVHRSSAARALVGAFGAGIAAPPGRVRARSTAPPSPAPAMTSSTDDVNQRKAGCGRRRRFGEAGLGRQESGRWRRPEASWQRRAAPVRSWPKARVLQLGIREATAARRRASRDLPRATGSRWPQRTRRWRRPTPAGWRRTAYVFQPTMGAPQDQPRLTPWRTAAGCDPNGTARTRRPGGSWRNFGSGRTRRSSRAAWARGSPLARRGCAPAWAPAGRT